MNERYSDQRKFDEDNEELTVAQGESSWKITVRDEGKLETDLNIRNKTGS